MDIKHLLSNSPPCEGAPASGVTSMEVDSPQDAPIKVTKPTEFKIKVCINKFVLCTFLRVEKRNYR